MWPFKRVDQTTGMVPNEEMDFDPRNLNYEEIAVFGAEVPLEGNVLARPIEALNQGRTTSCTCHSTVSAVHQTTGKLLSPRWAFWKIKTDKKYPSSELPYGAHMKDSVTLQVNEGICDYEYLPNVNTASNEEYLAFEDTPFLHENAKKHAGGSYLYMTQQKNSQAIFDAVVRYMWEQKRPVKVGVQWHQNYPEYSQVRKTGIVPAKFLSGTSTGHDMCAVAWKQIDGEPYLGFIQSFGESWGDKGMCWMPRNFTKFYSPIAVVPDFKQDDLGIKKPTERPVEKNKHKERANAQELTALVQVKFPRVGDLKADTENTVAQSIFGKEKLVFINAVSYLGWKFTDVINHLYARSRGKVDEDAYKLDFNTSRETWLKK